MRMGLERFADVVERFTHGYGSGNGHGPEPAPEVVRQWREELERTLRRMQNLHRRHTDPTDPKRGQPPRVEINKRNTPRLHRYQSGRPPRTPLLFAPTLGISGPNIFDLTPGGSFEKHI